MFNRMKTSYYQIAYFCFKCRKELSRNQRMMNCGVCPLCGFRDGVTIVKTTQRIWRYEWPENYRWWKFWIKPKRVFI